ncbi:hypothetical protein NE865_10393 [Phthorimaea operculella]|nr:hypothetical protein NE865_10393 [Phthorimaea operculella]
MPSTLKCSACNIVIDELLAVIQNKISVCDELTLVRLCSSAFTSDEIKKSKSLLFNAIPTQKRKINRKKDGKERRDLHDIIDLFRSVEPDDIPVFVARQLEKLPPLTFDHLDCTRLLKDIVLLRTDIDYIKSSYAMQSNVEELKQEIQTLKLETPSRFTFCNVNTRRGAWLGGETCSSGPMGMSHLHNSTFAPQNKEDLSSLRECEVNDSVKYRTILTSTEPLPNKHQDTVIEKHDKQSPPSPTTPVTLSHAAHASESETARKQTKCMQEPVLPTAPPLSSNLGTNRNEKDAEWQQVKRKKKPNYRYLGQFGAATCTLSENFKAADRKIPMFITNVHKQTKEEEITNYILSKTQERVSLEKILMRRPTNHDAYKFFINPDKLPLFMDVNLWPKGIIFRKFVHFKYKFAKQDGKSGPDNE